MRRSPTHPAVLSALAAAAAMAITGCGSGPPGSGSISTAADDRTARPTASPDAAETLRQVDSRPPTPTMTPGAPRGTRTTDTPTTHPPALQPTSQPTPQPAAESPISDPAPTPAPAGPAADSEAWRPTWWIDPPGGVQKTGTTLRAAAMGTDADLLRARRQAVQSATAALDAARPGASAAADMRVDTLQLPDGRYRAFVLMTASLTDE